MRGSFPDIITVVVTLLTVRSKSIIGDSADKPIHFAARSCPITAVGQQWPSGPLNYPLGRSRGCLRTNLSH